MSKKPYKQKTFLEVLQDQRDFADRVLLVQGFCEQYQKELERIAKNKEKGLTPIEPMLFKVFVSERVREYYKLEDGGNCEYIWEALDALVDDVENGTWGLTPKKYLGFTGVGGVYNQIDFVPKKKKTTVLELMDWVHNSDFAGVFS
jgi:hypothetical protein